MGAEILKLTRWTNFEKGEKHLKEFQCSNPGCGLFIDDKDIETKNYQLWVSDYANDIDKTSLISGQSCYSLNFWLRAVDHQECPESERCQGCWEKFRMNELKGKNDNWWCQDCQPTAFKKEVKHE
ncbi:hypothetical protein [endosymbiont GvMRE of Glomus versiforme]|uniref:hypothetical protein n=1 Tax=endosymbiont GvMRE of Glomus versiforme TaxID=2039283 RepID=UPI000EEF865E|nr:hypothetical protein [endosymbiont GvMRE of Glomus versiforme]RHZ35947.1 hypothetical protein GvMRE_Ic4g47 [endosymbiont GvMRE of Glomus versiforme]